MAKTYVLFFLRIDKLAISSDHSQRILLVFLPSLRWADRAMRGCRESEQTDRGWLEVFALSGGLAADVLDVTL